MQYFSDGYERRRQKRNRRALILKLLLLLLILIILVVVLGLIPVYLDNTKFSSKNGNISTKYRIRDSIFISSNNNEFNDAFNTPVDQQNDDQKQLIDNYIKSLTERINKDLNQTVSGTQVANLKLVPVLSPGDAVLFQVVFDVQPTEPLVSQDPNTPDKIRGVIRDLNFDNDNFQVAISQNPCVDTVTDSSLTPDPVCIVTTTENIAATTTSFIDISTTCSPGYE